MSSPTDKASSLIRLADHPPHRRHWILAWSIIVACYLGTLSSVWWPTPDSALYLSLARSLSAGDGYVFNGQPNILATPGLPWVLAGLNAVFGESLWAVNLLMALTGLATIVMVQLTLRRYGDPRLTLAVVLLTALGYPLLVNSQKVLTDVPFALLFWIALYGVARGRNGSPAWIGLVLAATFAAMLIRAPGALILGSLGLGLLLERRTGRRAWRCRIMGLAVWMASAAALGLMFLLMRQMQTEGKTYITAGKSITDEGVGAIALLLLGGLADIPFGFAEMLCGQEALVPFGAALVALFAIGVVRLWRSDARHLAVAAVMGIFLHAMLGAHSIRPRYLLAILPIVAYAALQGLCSTRESIARRRGRELTQTQLLRIVNVVVIILLACNVPNVARNVFWHTYLKHTGRFHQRTDNGDSADLFAIANLLRTDSLPPGRIGSGAGDVNHLHYLSGRIVAAPEPKFDDSGEPDTSAAAADAFMAELIAEKDLKFYVLPAPDDEPNAFETQLEIRLRMLIKDGTIRQVHAGENHRLFRVSTPNR